MKPFQIVGWKTYLVGALASICGGIALSNGYTGEGLKGIIAGLALVTLRDAIGKVLRAIDDNREALNNMRASLEGVIEDAARRRR